MCYKLMASLKLYVIPQSIMPKVMTYLEVVLLKNKRRTLHWNQDSLIRKDS